MKIEATWGGVDTVDVPFHDGPVTPGAVVEFPDAETLAAYQKATAGWAVKAGDSSAKKPAPRKGEEVDE